MSESQPPLVLGEKVWCPRCEEYVKIVRATTAAKVVDVDRRTIYNYIRKGKVHSFRVAGDTLRVCTHCLLRNSERGTLREIARQMNEAGSETRR